MGNRIVEINDDALVPPHFLKALDSLFALDPTIGVVGVRAIEDQYARFGRGIGTIDPITGEVVGNFDQPSDGPVDVDHVYGFCYAYTRQLVDSGLDTMRCCSAVTTVAATAWKRTTASPPAASVSAWSTTGGWPFVTWPGRVVMSTRSLLRWKLNHTRNTLYLFLKHYGLLGKQGLALRFTLLYDLGLRSALRYPSWANLLYFLTGLCRASATGITSTTCWDLDPHRGALFMKVVILAGGYGTRFGKVTDFLPKPMIPIGPYPILWHIMRIYGHYGFDDFIVCLGYKSELIKEFFLNYEAWTNDFTLDLRGVPEIRRTVHRRRPSTFYPRVTLAYTGQDTMTGGRLKRIADYIDGDDFMLTYGDGVADIPVDGLLAFHRHHGKMATLMPVYPPPKFGDLKLAGQAVTTFAEKQRQQRPTSTAASTFSNARYWTTWRTTPPVCWRNGPWKHWPGKGS